MAQQRRIVLGDRHVGKAPAKPGHGRANNAAGEQLPIIRRASKIAQASGVGCLARLRWAPTYCMRWRGPRQEDSIETWIYLIEVVGWPIAMRGTLSTRIAHRLARVLF